MADKKAERLINLTLALLATKRFLKKSEIFATVEGYSGSAEAMDRMFERDKNELRSLGIDITVGDLDPLFDDEPGYRIFKDTYSFQLKNLEPSDVSLLSIAAKLWNDSVLGVDAQASLIKLESLGIAQEESAGLTFSYRYENPNTNLGLIESALIDQKAIHFLYKDGTNTREVEPYRIFLWRGFWYFIGRDVSKNQIRSFKVTRIQGEVSITRHEFKAPHEFNIHHYLPEEESVEIEIEVPEGKAAILRNMGEVISTQNDKDLIRIKFSDFDDAMREILRHGKEIKVVGPKQFSIAYKSRLQELANV